MRLTRALGWRMGVIVAVTGAGLTAVGLQGVMGQPENPALRWTSLGAAIFVLGLGAVIIWEGWRGGEGTD